MANKVLYECDDVEGGTANALDAISHSTIVDESIALVTEGDVFYFYRYDVSSAVAQSIPDVIKPDDAGASNGRWILQNQYEANIDGDHLDIDWDPSNYTPDATPAEAADVDDLTAHLKGIDDEIAALYTGAAIDGDKLDIDWNPSYSTPDATPAEADDTDDLTAHLKGIDTELGKIPLTTWAAVSGAFSPAARSRNLVDTSGGAATATLPATPAVGDEIMFIDHKRTFGTYNLVLGRNAKKIMGAEEDLNVDLNNFNFILFYSGDDEGWIII